MNLYFSVDKSTWSWTCFNLIKNDHVVAGRFQVNWLIKLSPNELNSWYWFLESGRFLLCLSVYIWGLCVFFFFYFVFNTRECTYRKECSTLSLTGAFGEDKGTAFLSIKHICNAPQVVLLYFGLFKIGRNKIWAASVLKLHSLSHLTGNLILCNVF